MLKYQKREANGTVNILAANIEPLLDGEYYMKKLALVSSCRRQKAEALKMPHDKALSLGAAMLCDVFLKRKGFSERDMEYGFTENGKPYFINLPKLHFSISHSKDTVAVAFSESNVGLDLEKIQPAKEKLSRRFFTPNEAAAVLALDGYDKDLLFCKIWTAKESYLKLTGDGLARPLSSFDVLNEAFIKETGLCSFVFNGDTVFSLCGDGAENYSLETVSI